MNTATRCGHPSRIGTHCYRPAGHDGAHYAGFTDEEKR